MFSKKPIGYGKWTIYVIALAIIIRFALALIYTVSGDACWHLSAARFISNEGKFPLFEPIGRDEPFWAPPLFHIIAAFFYGLLGNFGMKLVSPIFGSLCLLVGHSILRKRLTEKATFYSMLFFSFLPLMMDYSILGYGEAVLTFFVLLSLYFALEGNFFAAGLGAGFSILSKYNGAFVVPALLWIAWMSREKWKNMVMVCIFPLLIATPWFVRNFLVLGNPIWPFLNFLFPSAFQNAFSSIDVYSLASIQTWQSLYLGFFGVPDGNYLSLGIVQIPLFHWAFLLFVLVTLLFLVPLSLGWEKNIKNMSFYLLLSSFGVLFFLYVANVGPFVSRMLMPSVIALALVYGRGAEQAIQKLGNEKLFRCAAILIALGFALAVAGKFAFAHEKWSVYQQDFDWVKENTPKDAVVLVGGQCVQFHIERSAVSPMQNKNYEYVWVNENFPLDGQSVLDKARLEKELENGKRVYENKMTGTKILERGKEIVG